MISQSIHGVDKIGIEKIVKLKSGGFVLTLNILARDQYVDINLFSEIKENLELIQEEI